jgi:ribosomal RNA-processing protein 36
MAKKHLRPQFSDEEDIEGYLQQSVSDSASPDELETISFGALKTAQVELDEQEQRKQGKKSSQRKKEVSKPLKEAKKSVKRVVKYVSETGSEGSEVDNDGFSDISDGMFDEEDDEAPTSHGGLGKKKGKHAPTETSSKKKVSKIRQIPGLENPRQTSLYRDIRFDTAFGKADMNRIRKDYQFLDEYRKDEVQEINKMLKDPKMRNKLSQHEIEDLEYQSKSLRSRLDTLKNRDLEQQVVKKYKEERGIKGNFFLKKSDKRKIIQKHKFENMKASQREKVVERKRKRKLGKEFRQLEFNRPRD